MKWQPASEYLEQVVPFTVKGFLLAQMFFVPRNRHSIMLDHVLALRYMRKGAKYVYQIDETDLNNARFRIHFHLLTKTSPSQSGVSQLLEEMAEIYEGLLAEYEAFPPGQHPLSREFADARKCQEVLPPAVRSKGNKGSR